MSPFPLISRGPLGPPVSLILLSEVEQERRPTGNGDREAIVVGAGLFDREGECAYTEKAPIRSGKTLNFEGPWIFQSERQRLI